MLAVGNPPRDGNTGRDHGRDGRHDAHPPRGEPRVQTTERDHVQTTGERAEHDVVPQRVAANVSAKTIAPAKATTWASRRTVRVDAWARRGLAEEVTRSEARGDEHPEEDGHRRRWCSGASVRV